MKIKFLVTFLFIVLLTGNLFALDRQRKIEVVKDNVHMVLTKSLYSQTAGMDESTKRLIYVSYISGFVDAMQLESSDDGAARKFLNDCQGLTLGDLIDTMIKFKDENPQFQNIRPAIVLTVVIPRLKKGLSPFPRNE